MPTVSRRWSPSWTNLWHIPGSHILHITTQYTLSIFSWVSLYLYQSAQLGLPSSQLQVLSLCPSKLHSQLKQLFPSIALSPLQLCLWPQPTHNTDQAISPIGAPLQSEGTWWHMAVWEELAHYLTSALGYRKQIGPGPKIRPFQNTDGCNQQPLLSEKHHTKLIT